MTDERMALQSLLEKTPDAEFLRRMIGFAAQRLMELDIESRTGSGAWRTFARSPCSTQRLSRPRLGDAGRHG